VTVEPTDSIEIGASDIRALAWPGSNATVRVVPIAGAPWFVAADLCRALDFAMSANRKPSVTEALKTVGVADRRFARLEVDPGSFKPYSRMALTSPAGVVVMVARKRRAGGAAGLPEETARWIAEAVALAIPLRSRAEPPPERRIS